MTDFYSPADASTAQKRLELYDELTEDGKLRVDREGAWLRQALRERAKARGVTMMQQLGEAGARELAIALMQWKLIEL